MAKYSKHKEVFSNFLGERNLRKTGPRDGVLGTLLMANKHISADELHTAIKATLPSIGYATVCRSLKLLCESGLAREIKIGNNKSLYEAKLDSEHHDHLICLQCGTFVEFYSEDMERLQEEIVATKGFYILRHKMEIYGLCKKCQRAKKKE